MHNSKEYHLSITNNDCALKLEIEIWGGRRDEWKSIIKTCVSCVWHSFGKKTIEENEEGAEVHGFQDVSVDGVLHYQQQYRANDNAHIENTLEV